MNKTVVLDAEFKSRWVAALRRGGYRQAIGQLRAGDAFCCLGVACDLDASIKWEGEEAVWGKEGDRGEWREIAILPPPFAASIGLSARSQSQLSARNDDGDSFAMIAQWIEDNL